VIVPAVLSTITGAQAVFGEEIVLAQQPGQVQVFGCRAFEYGPHLIQHPALIQFEADDRDDHDASLKVLVSQNA
jgi:hypothetical protein